jgi:signal transduction histidine kinase
VDKVAQSENSAMLGEATKSVAEFLPVLDSETGKRQLAETTRALPVLILFHLCAAIAISNVTGHEVPLIVLRSWQVAALVAAAAFSGVLHSWQNHAEDQRRTALLLKLMPLLGVFLAAIWAVPPIMFTNFTAPDTNVIIYGVVLTMMGVGVGTLLRLPATATLYSIFLSGVISQSLYNGLSSHQLIAAFICIVFGMALVGIILVANRDFMLRLQSELELIRQSQIIKLLLNDFERDTSDWLWETGQDGELIYYSPRLGEILAKPDDQMLRKDFLELINAQSDPQAPTSLSGMMISHAEIPSCILAVILREQTQHWQLTARPQFNAAGHFTGYRGVGRDISVQWESDQEIRNSRDQAEKANAAKSQFLAVISHELRTPINAIVGFSEVLNATHGDTLSNAARRDYQNLVLESAHHLQSLINDVLDATRIERGSMQLEDQVNDAGELIEIAIKTCRDQAAKANVTIIAHITDDVQIIGDLSRLKQVVLNLVSNAVKYSPVDGTVNIDMQAGANRELVISIRDTGIGIEAGDVERLFDPFVQADQGSTRRFAGLGLGLAIARKIARLHGGDVTLTGKAGVGTEARFIIPAARVRWPKTARTNAMVAA